MYSVQCGSCHISAWAHENIYNYIKSLLFVKNNKDILHIVYYLQHHCTLVNTAQIKPQCAKIASLPMLLF